MTKDGWVYIMANRYRGGMYVGVTADALARVYQHREGMGSRHVADFAKTRLVYIERHEEIEQPRRRSRRIIGGEGNERNTRPGSCRTPSCA